MSEEAVRQTRSQKRALEREVPLPPTTEPSAVETDCKKPKLDDDDPPSSPPDPDLPPSEPETPTLAEDGQSRTMSGPEAEREQPPGPDQGPLLPPPLPPPPLTPLVLPIPQLIKEPERHQRPPQQQAEPGPDNRTECNDQAGRAAKTETPVADARSRLRPSEPRASGGLLSAGEVKATIKVEVQTREQPMDMSSAAKGSVKREKRPPSPDDDDDDCIILSDNDSSPSPPMNGLSHFRELDTDLLMRSTQEERERIIKQLKEELRLEEAKLVLLKKLRQSQIQKDTLQKPSGMSGSVAPPPLIRGTITGNKGSQQQQMSTGRSSGTVIPPPLVRGGQQLVSSKHGGSHQILMPPLVRGSQPISVSPQQIQALRQQQQLQLAASGDSGGPPPLLLAPRASVPGGQNQRGMLPSGLIRVNSVGNASLLVSITQASSGGLKSSSSLSSQSQGGGSVSVVNVNDTPASRQAAAKLALRKQLEKTLLEIPPPKPPAPEFNFLPSAANNEFIYLVGLEEVVQNLLDNLHRGKSGMSKPAAREPYTCTQCHTDFTCRWRKDKAKGGTILCEDCMSSNQKKALKAEHTNRLKAAFVKALQQEQEIEQRILQQAASSPVSHAASSSSSSSMRVEQLVSQQLKQQVQAAQARSSSSMQHHHHQHSRGQSMVHHHSSNIKQGQLSRNVSSMGVRGGPHTFSSSSQLQSAVAAAALVNRPGKHITYVSRPSSLSSKVGSHGGIVGGSNVSGGSSASATAWRKQSSTGNTGVTMAYVNPSLSGHKSSSSADARQREYLLDMIPSRSISQTANTWK